MLEVVINSATALSAVAAVGVSLILLRMQLRDRNKDRRDRERVVANRVSCWAAWSEEGLYVLSGGCIREPVVCLTNQAEEPVYGVFFDYRHPVDGHPVRVEVGVLPPGTTQEVPVEWHGKTEKDWQPEHLLPVLYFRDTGNRWWQRNTVGYLVEDPGPGQDGFSKSGGEQAGRFVPRVRPLPSSQPATPR